MARSKRRGSTCILIGVLLLIGALGLTAYNLWDENRAGVREPPTRCGPRRLRRCRRRTRSM